MIHLTDHIRHLWRLIRRVPFAVWLWCTLDLSISDAWSAARDDDWARRGDRRGYRPFRDVARELDREIVGVDMATGKDQTFTRCICLKCGNSYPIEHRSCPVCQQRAQDATTPRPSGKDSQPSTGNPNAAEWR